MFDAVSHLELILKCDGAMQVCRNGLRNVMALCSLQEQITKRGGAMQLFYPLHAYILTTRKRRGICKKSSVRKDFEEPSNAI